MPKAQHYIFPPTHPKDEPPDSQEGHLVGSGVLFSGQLLLAPINP
jgi:hypothetical protein